MKVQLDKELPRNTVIPFDYGSAAFSQKMLNHYRSNGRKLGTNVEKIPANKRNDSTILLNPDNPPDNPLGGSASLPECWRSVCGHFRPCPASIDQAMDFSQAAKLSRNLPRHHLAS
jgi:hypothetical protein